MNKTLKKVLIIVGSIAAIVVLCVLLSLTADDNFSEKYAGVDLTADIEGVTREGTYKGYLASHEGASYPSGEVSVDLLDYSSTGSVETRSNFEGVSESVFTDVDSTITWKINVPEAGFYNLYVEYFIPKSHGVEAERGVYINGELPFNDAQSIEFKRVWTDGGEKRIDNQGNEIRPTQVEKYVWQSSLLYDDRGYTNDPYAFYFNAGENTITLEGENEPFIIKKLSIKGVVSYPSYSEYIASYSSAQNSAAASFVTKIQGEDSTYRSEPSLYAKYDRSSPTTEPCSVTATVLNYTGGDAWRSNGMWIEWDFTVPADGFYNITIKGRQNYARGSVANRCIYIDGEIPFEEVREVSFPYSNDWNYMTLSDDEGTPYNFYLTAGTHTIRVEATLGSLGELLETLEDTTYRLNQVYRKILVYTGATPDQYRDYNVDRVYPEVIEAMKLESLRLFKFVDDCVAYTGQKDENIASAQTVALQLERFVERPQRITSDFVQFKDNVTSLGTSALNMSTTKLDIDYLVVSGTEAVPEFKQANAFMNIWHEIKSFFASFIVDYNAVGDVYDGNEDDVITIWVLTGRDQGTIMKALVDDSFTPSTGIPVNVEVIGADAVLSAVLAGRGPDVILSTGADQPVNFALRGAAVDLTQFEGWEEVFSHYSESSYEQYKLEGGIYGLPETQTFTVMFYRKDILEELELEIPNTWKELIEMLPTIQGNNLSVGIPTAAGSSGATAASTAVMSNNPDLSMYFSLLYQYGGDMYNEDGTKTVVNDEAGVKAFDDYVTYFNDYGLPTIYDFVSRFRSGEMPIGIQPYSTYNTLMVSAPEIRGLWDFTLIPGTERVDENGNTYIDRSDFITGSCTMMIDNHNETRLNNAWEFLKWWAEPDTQISFGREIEALLGASARYATANRDAFSSLSWSADDIAVLNEQWDWSVGIREVPGGYFTGRHISNAARKVLNEKVDSRETIIDYSIMIDEEITRKRKEFGLPVYED